MGILDWPVEMPGTSTVSPALFSQADSNQILDFHGDPLNAEFCLFSDGNHHMALAEVMSEFSAAEPELDAVFYLTLPPPALRNILKAGSVRIANLQFPLSPNMIISPSTVLKQLEQTAACQTPQAFISGLGYAWLLPKSNPKQFSSTVDLIRDDIRLFISNPRTEKNSYDNYLSAILGMSADNFEIQK